VIVAERDVEPVFASHEYAIDALPEPDALPELTVSHAAFDVAVQAHVEAHPTRSMLPEPAVAGTDAVDDASVYVHAGTPACVTVSTRPPAVIVALRNDGVVFASHEYAICAVPLPDVLSPLTVSHAAFDVAVQAHVDGVAQSVVQPEPEP
jgi:hypothetical protein